MVIFNSYVKLPEGRRWVDVSFFFSVVSCCVHFNQRVYAYFGQAYAAYAYAQPLSWPRREEVCDIIEELLPMMLTWFLAEACHLEICFWPRRLRRLFFNLQ